MLEESRASALKYCLFCGCYHGELRDADILGQSHQVVRSIGNLLGSEALLESNRKRRNHGRVNPSADIKDAV